MKKLFLALSLLPLFAGASTPVQDIKPVWNLKEIVGKPQKVVETILDKPIDDCNKGKYGLTCRYKKDGADWEIVYINGKSDWLTLTDKRVDNARNSPVWLGYNLDEFGSPEVGPIQLKWESVSGLISYQVFHLGDQETIDYIYIKTKTP